MNKKDVENKVKKSFNNVTPNVYQSIERDVANVSVNRTAPRRARGKNLFWKLASGILSLVLVVMAVIGVVGTVNQTAQASSVSLDVNPSVEIILNRNNRVVKVNALNSDGEVIIADMDFNGCQLKVAVNALIGSMLRAGYLSDMANSVLVSVDADKNNYQTIAELVANEITLTLKQGQIEASVVSQWIQNDDDVAAIAKQYNISLGKAQLISKIVAKTEYTVEQLAELSVNELSLLLPNIDIGSDDVEQSGAASDKKYIEQTEALNNALTAAQITDVTAETEGFKYKAKLDFDDGEMVYDVEFTYGGYEYDVEVGAVSGKVVAYQKSFDGYFVAGTDVTVASKEDAQDRALVLAGNLTEADVTNLYAAQMRYARSIVYEVFFRTDDMFYQYCIGSDGTVVEEYYEMITLSDEDSYLRREQVVSYFIAHNKDGFNELDVNGRARVSTEKTVDGKLAYELSFESKGILYVYRIDALTRDIKRLEASEITNGNQGGNGGSHYGPGGGFGHGGGWFWDFDDDFDDWNDFEDFDDWEDFDDFDDHRRPAYNGHYGAF